MRGMRSGSAKPIGGSSTGVGISSAGGAAITSLVSANGRAILASVADRLASKELKSSSPAAAIPIPNSQGARLLGGELTWGNTGSLSSAERILSLTLFSFRA
jgi:hypothetical protein